MKKEDGGYLFVHFAGETENGEQIYFSASRDGLHWTDLNRGEPVLCSTLGEKGVRDPFILRSELDGNYYIMATDLRIASGKGWQTARSSGSKKILLWKSSRLFDWSNPWEYEVPMEQAGCVWAPEACYDEERKAYLVFWASLTQEASESRPKFKFFCSYTKDFLSFSVPKKYMERERSVIDLTIIRDGGVYYRFIKDEETGGIVGDFGHDLQGPFEPLPLDSLRQITGVEGPLVFPLPNKKAWCLMVDRFKERAGYLPLISLDLKKADFIPVPPTEYDLGVSKKRHGSVLTLSEKEYKNLLEAYG